MHTLTLRSALLSSALLASLAGCSPYNPELQGAPFLCGQTDPQCPDGYLCQADGEGRMVCLTEGGMAPDAAPSGFQCADDSPLEPNDTHSSAFQTPVATQRMELSLGPLAICPEGDRDHFAVNITQPNQNLEVLVTWDSGPDVGAAILNAAGTSINNGIPMGERGVRAYTPNLPVGTYYASVFASGATKNNYRLQIKVTGP